MKNSIAAGLVAGILSLAPAMATETNCKDDSRYPEINKQKLTEKIEKKEVFVVDVNSADSFKKNHIPGAIHYGADEKGFTGKLPADKDALIVAYCGGVKCTAWKKAAHAACESGYTNVKHFKPGIKGWAEKG